MCYEGFAVVQAGYGVNLDYWHRSSRDVCRWIQELYEIQLTGLRDYFGLWFEAERSVEENIYICLFTLILLTFQNFQNLFHQ